MRCAEGARTGREGSDNIKEMRVIAGTYRSRPLIAPRGLDTRPTTDRLRETLFNVLAPRIRGARFADLYAGSGAVGIEALSRGAASVFFAESSPAALATLRANLGALRIGSGYRVEGRPVLGALRAEVRRSPQWDIVFLDPPYGGADEYAQTLTMLAQHAASLIAPEAMVIAEHRRKSATPLAPSYGGLQRFRLLEQGDAALSFYSLQVAGEAQAAGGDA
jgi:16S rRNA (guanine966-N2)-methyltransferase